MPFLLTALALLSLAAHLVSAARGAATLVFLFKPLTTALVIALAWTVGDRQVSDAARYRRRILAGLACSLVGDVALMLPVDGFVPGLVAFLLAHLCYIAAFASRAGRLRLDLSAIPFALGYVLLVGSLAPHTGALVGPVSVYGAVLLAMAWCALATWRARPMVVAREAAIGAMLFVVSDTLLAFGRFVPGAPRSEVAVMTTYIAAQLLIAWSARRSGSAPLHPAP